MPTFLRRPDGRLVEQYAQAYLGDRAPTYPADIMTKSRHAKEVPAQRVYDYLRENYPARVLGWAKKLRWEYRRSVPLKHIHMDRRPGGRDPAKVRGIAEAIDDGKPMDPVVLVCGSHGYWIADGYHRTLAFRHAGRQRIAAYIAEVDSDEGPWRRDMHDAKLNKAVASSEPADSRLERLAQAIHNMWMSWAVHAAENVDAKTRKRWQPMLVPYEDLPDEEKQKDRVEAIALLDALDNTDVQKSHLLFPVTKGYLTTGYGEGRAPSKTPDAGKRLHQTAAIDATTSEESLPTIRINGFTPNVIWALLRRTGYQLRITDGQAMLPGQTTIRVTSDGATTLQGPKASAYAAWFNRHLRDMVDWAGQIDGKQEVSSIRSHGGHFS